MKEKILDILKKYIIHILILIIITLIIVIGFLYASKTTKKQIIEPVIKEEKQEIKEVNKIKVDIKGAVKKEGVYELEEKNRVIDVVKLAGGLKNNADTSLINLSKIIKDEMVIIIYTEDEMKEFRKENKIEKYTLIEKECICPDNINDACIENNKDINDTTENKQQNSDEIKTTEETNNNLVSINTASKEELLTITGIGESKANSIIEYRETNGLFNKIEDIKNVSGIGDSLFEKIKDYITI